MKNTSPNPAGTLQTHSVKLLEARIPDFDAARYMRRWERYQLGDKLGEGGMAVVHFAIDAELRRDVAIKCVSDESNTDLVDRFFDEIQLHAKLQHPGVPPLHDFGLTPQGHLFLAMELVFGDSLSAQIKRYHASGEQQTGSLHLTDLLQRFLRVCETLAYAHSVGIVHRDVTPGNVMCGDYGEVFLMDWGLATTIAVKQDGGSDRLPVVTDAARALAKEEVRRNVEDRTAARRKRRQPTVPLAHHSMLGHVVGTVGYMPPEQALGRADMVSPRSDVYALGCMLYTILCGQLTVSDAPDVWNRLDQVIDGHISAPDQRGAARTVPAGLAQIAMKAMAREPRDRYASAGDVREAVQAWMHRQAEANIVLLEVESFLEEAEEHLRAGRPEMARSLLDGASDRLAGIDGADRLRQSIQRVHEFAARDIAQREARESAQRRFRMLHEALMESQFGLVLSHLRLPAPTIRRAHDRLFAELQACGVWDDPLAALKTFETYEVHKDPALRLSGDARSQLLTAIYLLGWGSVRLALVTSKDHGRDAFINHAETAMQHVNRLAPEYRAPKLNLAAIKRIRGLTEEAEHYEKIAEETPVGGAEDYIFLATISFTKYQLAEAHEQLLTALVLDPAAFWGHALMIFVCNAMGDNDGTFAALRTCQALQPKEPVLWTVRGFLLREMGRFDEAHDALDRALRHGPNDSLARLIRADLRKRLGRIDWQRDLDGAADLVTPPVKTWDYFVLALIALQKNDTEYALEFVHAAQKRSPGMPQLYGLEASILMRRADFAEAERLLLKGLDMAPNEPRLIESLLGLLVYQKRYGEACAKYQAEESRRAGSATPNGLLLAARAFAGYAGTEGDEEDSAGQTQALMLLERAARSQMIAKAEVDSAPEFNYLRENSAYKHTYRMLRDGPPAPRLFQPALGGE